MPTFILYLSVSQLSTRQLHVPRRASLPPYYTCHNLTSTQVIDKYSMKAVLGNCSDFKFVKSMIERALNARGHEVMLSSKFHAEVAGVGIEYDFGRAKWWYRKNNRLSTKSLKELSAASFASSVVSLKHTRKFARKSRDYMRAYRAGAKGLEADSTVSVLRTHRCALDTHHAFVIADDVD